MVTAPGATPHIIPVAEPIDALVVGLQVHTPPATLFVSGTQSTTHILEGPMITPGAAETVTVTDAAQPDGNK